MSNSKPTLTLTPELAREILARPELPGSLKGLNMSWEERFAVEAAWGESDYNTVGEMLKALAKSD